MEVKIGVQFGGRELVLESALTPAEIAETVSKALSEDAGVLSLTDEKGRQQEINTQVEAAKKVAP